MVVVVFTALLGAWDCPNKDWPLVVEISPGPLSLETTIPRLVLAIDRSNSMRRKWRRLKASVRELVTAYVDASKDSDAPPQISLFLFPTRASGAPLDGYEPTYDPQRFDTRSQSVAAKIAKVLKDESPSKNNRCHGTPLYAQLLAVYEYLSCTTDAPSLAVLFTDGKNDHRIAYDKPGEGCKISYDSSFAEQLPPAARIRWQNLGAVESGTRSCTHRAPTGYTRPDCNSILAQAAEEGRELADRDLGAGMTGSKELYYVECQFYHERFCHEIPSLEENDALGPRFVRIDFGDDKATCSSLQNSVSEVTGKELKAFSKGVRSLYALHGKFLSLERQLFESIKAIPGTTGKESLRVVLRDRAAVQSLRTDIQRLEPLYANLDLESPVENGRLRSLIDAAGLVDLKRRRQQRLDSFHRIEQILANPPPADRKGQYDSEALTIASELTVAVGARVLNCSGTLLSSTHVLTAAHCLPVSQVFYGAKLGANGTRRKVAYSDGSRSPIPIDADHPIRWKPIALNDRSRSRFPIEGDRLILS